MKWTEVPNSQDYSNRNTHPSGDCGTGCGAARAECQETAWPHAPAPAPGTKDGIATGCYHLTRQVAQTAKWMQIVIYLLISRPLFSVVLNLFLLSNMLLGKKSCDWDPTPQRIHQLVPTTESNQVPVKHHCTQILLTLRFCCSSTENNTRVFSHIK